MVANLKDFPFGDVYKVEAFNWYKSLPYGFLYTTANNDTMRAWLPIAPSNLTITTHFATNVITTLYGVVEEHSEIRYYDIAIQGTTGFSPRWPAPGLEAGDKTFSLFSLQNVVTGSSSGRDGFVENPFLAFVNTGFFQQTIGTATTAFQQVANLFGGNGESGIPLTKDSSTIEELSGPVTGYLAFHNFYRLLHLYKRDASGQSFPGVKRDFHPLTFVNNKDGNQYDVAPVSFTLTRSADSPMLYNYNIQMRGFNLRSIYLQPNLGEIDQAAAWGLGGKNSMFNKISNAAGAVASGLSAVAALTTGIGG